MKHLILERWPEMKGLVQGTIGRFREFNIYTLELPWKDNLNNVSCIPSGTYLVKWEMSFKLKKHYWHLQSVPKREGILIHKGNHLKDSTGCIILGSSFWLNGDGTEWIVRESFHADALLAEYLGTDDWTLGIVEGGR